VETDKVRAFLLSSSRICLLLSLL